MAVQALAHLLTHIRVQQLGLLIMLVTHGIGRHWSERLLHLSKQGTDACLLNLKCITPWFFLRVLVMFAHLWTLLLLLPCSLAGEHDQGQEEYRHEHQHAKVVNVH